MHRHLRCRPAVFRRLSAGVALAVIGAALLAAPSRSVADEAPTARASAPVLFPRVPMWTPGAQRGLPYDAQIYRVINNVSAKRNVAVFGYRLPNGQERTLAIESAPCTGNKCADRRAFGAASGGDPGGVGHRYPVGRRHLLGARAVLAARELLQEVHRGHVQEPREPVVVARLSELGGVRRPAQARRGRPQQEQQGQARGRGQAAQGERAARRAGCDPEQEPSGPLRGSQRPAPAPSSGPGPQHRFQAPLHPQAAAGRASTSRRWSFATCPPTTRAGSTMRSAGVRRRARPIPRSVCRPRARLLMRCSRGWRCRGSRSSSTSIRCSPTTSSSRSWVSRTPGGCCSRPICSSRRPPGPWWTRTRRPARATSTSSRRCTATGRGRRA